MTAVNSTPCQTASERGILIRPSGEVRSLRSPSVVPRIRDNFSNEVTPMQNTKLPQNKNLNQNTSKIPQNQTPNQNTSKIPQSRELGPEDGKN
jgi:hypothetical protein